MLEIVIPESDVYLPSTNHFLTIPACTLTLEHSLISIAKWESKWCIPYFGKQARTLEQDIDYVRCMVVGAIKNDAVFSVLTQDNKKMIKAYMDLPMTATTFSKTSQKVSKEIVTAEVLYYRMFSNNIPLECQKWHLNRLLTLIRVCETKAGPGSKMSKRETSAFYSQQNALRRAKHKTKG